MDHKVSTEGMNPYAHGMKIRNTEDFFPRGFTPEELERVYYKLTAGRIGGYSILESPSFEEVDEYFNPGLYVVDDEAIFEAIIIDKFAKTEAKMRQVGVAIGRNLKDTDISVLNPVVGKPKRAGTFAYVTVQIPFSDGQTVSVVFHSPEGDRKKIGPDDQIIAFRWLLNKRDITHVVAPEDGQEVTALTIGKRLGQLVEKNHAHFISTQKDAVEEQKKLDGLKVQAEALDTENAMLAQQADKGASEAAGANIQVANTAARIEKQKAYNAKLEAEIDAFKAKVAAKVVVEPTSGGNKRIETQTMTGSDFIKVVSSGYGGGRNQSLKEAIDRYNKEKEAVGSTERAEDFLTGNKKSPIGVRITEEQPQQPAPEATIDHTTPEGYAQIMADKELQLKYQDGLDSMFQTRLVDTRNALRGNGWNAPEGALTMMKEVPNYGTHSVEHDLSFVGAGKNVTGITWIIDGGTTKISDDLTKTPEQIATEIDASVQQEQPVDVGGDDFKDLKSLSDDDLMSEMKKYAIVIDDLNKSKTRVSDAVLDYYDNIIAEQGRRKQEYFNTLSGAKPEERYADTENILDEYLGEFGYVKNGDKYKSNGTLPYAEIVPQPRGGYKVKLSEFTSAIEDKLLLAGENSGKDINATKMAYREAIYKLGEDEANKLLDATITEPDQTPQKLAPAPQQDGNPAKRTAKIIYHHDLQERVMGADDFIVRIEPKEGPNLIIDKSGTTLSLQHLEKRNGKVMIDQAITFTENEDGTLELDSTVIQGPNGMIRGKDLTIAQAFTKSLIDQGLAKSGILKDGRGLVDDEVVGLTAEEKVSKASELGKKSFLEGKASAPALDIDLQEMFIGSSSEEINDMLNAWTKAWHSENLAQPIQDEPEPQPTKAPSETSMDRASKFYELSKAVRHFMSNSQLKAIYEGVKGEEGDFFIEKMQEIANTIQTMPKTYEQDGKGNDAVVYLKYFAPNGDWWITEKDASGEQLQAFGLASINNGEPELGYIDLTEITKYGAELDLYWEPKTLGAVKGVQNQPDTEQVDVPVEPETIDATVTPEQDGNVGDATEQPTVTEQQPPFVSKLESILSGQYDNNLADLEARFEEALTEAEQAGLDGEYSGLIEQVSDYYTAKLSEKAKEV